MTDSFGKVTLCCNLQPLAPTEWYGRLSFGPVLPGQGLTVGNTLRRVLLNDLKGISVVGAEIAGVDNEFFNLTWGS